MYFINFLVYVNIYNLNYNIYNIYRSCLRHSEDIDNTNSIIVNEFTQHQTHHFHRYSGTAMLEHFQEGQGRYVYL